MRLILGDFPHLCPGAYCRICRWVSRAVPDPLQTDEPSRKSPEAASVNKGGTPVPAPVKRLAPPMNDSDGKTWPEIVAEIVWGE